MSPEIEKEIREKAIAVDDLEGLVAAFKATVIPPRSSVDLRRQYVGELAVLEWKLARAKDDLRDTQLL